MDQASMEALYRTYGSMVLRRARTLLGDDHAAQDMVQEVFMNAIRDGARRRRALERRMPAREPMTESAEDRVGVDELLQQLPRELAEVAIYYYVDQMNQDEIATLLGISERTVRNRLRDFKEAARDRLDPESEEAAG